MFNHAGYIAEAIQSVLGQTYPGFDIVIVDDASTDGSADIVRRFNDPRIISIIHKRNCGPAVARNTGIRASSGEYVAFLDADDFFHPAKLEAHVNFLENHPEIDVTYNSRFELNYSSGTIRNLVRPPEIVDLTDLVQGFPFSTSDMVLRREKLLGAGLFGGDLTWSEELELNCKLALAGCRFARVDRALNYRRFESGRIFDNLAGKYESANLALERIFADPRFPADALHVHSMAFANIHLVYGLLALEQGETAFGQRLMRAAVRLKPELASHGRCELLMTILRDSIADDGHDHETYLGRMISQLPDEFIHISESVDWAIGQGYILKGCRAVLWNRLKEGDDYFQRAVLSDAHIEEFVIEELVYHLLSFQVEFGEEAAESALQRLTTRLEKLGNKVRVRRMEGDFLINQAFQRYKAGGSSPDPKIIVRAVLKKPELLFNRGVLVIFIRSLLSGGI